MTLAAARLHRVANQSIEAINYSFSLPTRYNCAALEKFLCGFIIN